MAISDINKMMAMYAQPTEFDQNAWKTAFDIANAFTGAENSRTIANENARKHQENLATQDWRVKFQNNAYETGIGTNNVKLADLKRLYSNALQTDPSAIQSTIAQNNFNTTQYKIGEQGILGQDEAARLVSQYGFNPDGTVRSMPQVYQAAQADGKQVTNPYAFSPFWTASNQERANQQALYQDIVNNSMGTTIDAAGNVVSTGQIDPQKLTNELNIRIATGRMTKEQADNLRKGFSIEVPHQEIKRFQPILNPQPQIISPYRLDAQPQQTVSVMPTAAQAFTPPQTPVVALTPEQQQAVLVKSLNDQQAQNELRFSGAYINSQEELKRKELENAMKSYNRPTLPFYLTY